MSRASLMGAGFGVVVAALLSMPARGNDRADLAVLLARVCVSEVTWDEGPDCAAIVATLEHRAVRRGMTLAGMARAYSSRVFDRGRKDTRRWVAHLERDGRRPEGWPPGSSWERVGRPNWFATLERVEHALETREHDCEETPDHWGSPTLDIDRPLRYGWIRVDCPGALNAFWRVPRRR